MTMRPVLGFLMVALTAVAFAVNHQARVVPIAAIALAGAGMFGWIRVRLPARRELILFLFVALIFVVVWRLGPSSVSRSPIRRLVTLLTNYFMLMQVAQFFIRRGGDLPAYMPFYSAMTLIAAGNVLATPTQDTIYQACALGFTALAAVFAISCKVHIRKAPPMRRGVLAAILLAVALTGAGIAGHQMYRYREELDRYFMQWFERRMSAAGSVRATAVQLDSVTPMRMGSQRNRVAMRVFSQDSPGYMKGAAYTRLTKSTWHADISGSTYLPVTDRPPELADLPDHWKLFLFRPDSHSPWRRYTVWPDTGLGGTVYTPMHASAVGMATEAVTVTLQGVVEVSNPEAAVNYAAFVPAKAPPVSLDAKRRRAMTDVMSSLDGRIRKLADEVFKGCSTTAEKIRAVERYFHAHYTYKIGIEIPEGADPLTWFLIERPPGHCEYFAAGAALLLRLAGVPACYVTGYVVKERNPQGDYWIARNKDAHAWVEAYDESRGWVLVEATPGGGVPEALPRSRLSYFWDNLKFRIRELYLLIATRGLPGLGIWLADRLRSLLAFLMSLSLTALLFKNLALALLVWWLWGKIRRPSRSPGDPSIVALHRLLRVVDRRARRFGFVRLPSETLHRFARRLSDSASPPQRTEAYAAWYLAYAAVRYRGDIREKDVQQLGESTP